MLEQGIIRPSCSEWASPIVLVPKRGGGTRFCVDYRALNSKTKKWPYPLPRVDDNIDSFRKKVLFSLIDCNQGFWQINMDEESIPLTAFRTHMGHFEFVRMPFGLCNAVATYQKLTDLIFMGLKGIDCIVYLDDAAIASISFEGHMAALREVFLRFRTAGMTI